MKVLDLQCQFQHVFEGWFGSEDDFVSQKERGLIECPVCGNAAISKRLSAPRLNFGAAAPASSAAGTAQAGSNAKAPAQDMVVAPSAGGAAVPGPASGAELYRAWMDMTRQVLANTDDVGDKFAEEARKIHYGETEARGIRGKASPEQTRELLEEGIAVSPLFVPESLKKTLQ
jgi:hypothetical protein